MRNINDEFHFGEKQDEFIRNEEYTFLEERGEYDERFFHWDEYNREFIGGLREKEEGEEAEEEEELVHIEESKNRNLFFHRTIDTIKIAAMVLATSTVILTSPVSAKMGLPRIDTNVLMGNGDWSDIFVLDQSDPDPSKP